jgi:spore germination cell wall hydrolase CwlJ-like protein
MSNPLDSGNPDLAMLARLLYGENRQDMTPEEAAAIVDTIRNRTELQGWPATIQEVLTQPHQFQPLSPKGSAASQANADVSAAFAEGDPRWNEYMTFAQYGLQDIGPRQRGAYTHYWSGDQEPKWAAKLQGKTRIGRHTFAVEPGRKKKAKR